MYVLICFHLMQFLTSLNIMDYSLLVGIHDCELAGTEDDVDYSSDSRVDSNEDSDPESPRDSDSPGEGDVSFSDTPPITPPANADRERTTSFGSNEFDDDNIQSWSSQDGQYFPSVLQFLTYCNKLCTII